METGRVGKGLRQSCSAPLERVGKRSVVGELGEKCRDRKRMAGLQRGGLVGQGGCHSKKAIVDSVREWDCQSLVYRCRS